MKKQIILLSTAIAVVVVGTIGAILLANHGNLSPANASVADEENKTVIATVNGEEIYQSAVDFQREYERLSSKNVQGSPNEDGQNRQSVSGDEEILKELIRKKVILQEAKKQELPVRYEDAYAQAKATFETVKSGASGKDADSAIKENYRFLREYMKATHMSEERYLEEAAVSCQNVLARNALYAEFLSIGIGQASLESEQQDFEKFVDALVEDADVEIR